MLAKKVYPWPYVPYYTLDYDILQDSMWLRKMTKFALLKKTVTYLCIEAFEFTIYIALTEGII